MSIGADAVEFDPSRDLAVPDQHFTAKSIDLHFLPVIDRREDREPSWVTLVAFVHVTPVGYISWQGDSGAVDLILVAEPLRRRGIGSALFAQARRIADERGWLEPWIGSDRSDAGEALARTLVDSDDRPTALSTPSWEEMSVGYYGNREQRWRAWGWSRGSDS